MEPELEMPTENKMGVMPVNRLLCSMAIPMMISMLVQALYNVVDSMFVAQINENALTAVSLAFPAQNLMIAVATGTGVGVNALLSRSLGAKDFERANSAANHAVFLALCSFAVFALLGGFFSRFFFTLQTDVEEIVNYGTDYLVICTVFSFGLFGQVSFERLLQSTGKTFYTMITQGVGAIINIIMDPVMIFAMDMGVAGAAAATVLGQIVAFCLAVIFNRKCNHEIQLSLRHFRLRGAVVRQIYEVGVPSIIMTSISSVMTFGMNKILIAFSTTATAVFGVYFKLQSFVFMPVFGLNNGMVPIIAYNYGAKKPDRIRKTMRLSVTYAMGIMLIGLAVVQIFPRQLLRIFDASDYMLKIGEPALRIISLSFLLAGFSVICSSVFQSLSHGMLSLWVSVLRQLVVLLPMAYVLARIFGPEIEGLVYVWIAFPIAEVITAMISFFLIRHVIRKEVLPLREQSSL